MRTLTTCVLFFTIPTFLSAKDRDATPEDYEIVSIIDKCHLDDKGSVEKLKSAVARGGQLGGFKYLGEINGKVQKIKFNPYGRTFIFDCIAVLDYLCETQGKHKCLATYGNYCNANNTPRIKALVRNGANVNTPDQNGFSVIHNCLRYGNSEAITFLMQNGADIDISEGEILTAAAETGDEKLIDLILSYKPKIFHMHDEKIWQPGKSIQKTQNDRLIKKLQKYYDTNVK
ncbi:ankyrin repeat domain-containing protein [Turneriella parva]|uniref:Ankyrin n=1 Tax=Turneriella parva (strain ATCC BAA-1111 / DSM 21527 / NCTC 11395 / H) TaxID=869212 RepID=I4BA16_TURPD|nr:ankyrin repeat domain-containing protein [Turneriella parva]AFM14123.1 Ankyrin [Turneriella parva DSM 21527]